MKPTACWSVLGVFGVLILFQAVSAGPAQIGSCLGGKITNVVNRREMNAIVHIDFLGKQIVERIALYNSTRDLIMNNQRSAVTNAVTELNDHVSRLMENLNLQFQSCLRATRQLITNYANSKLAAIATCSSIAIADISSDLTALGKLKETVMNSVNTLCGWLVRITSCSTSLANIVAKRCSQTNRNSAEEQRANMILRSVEAKIRSTRSALDQCISAINLSSDKEFILALINTCTVNTTTGVSTEGTTTTTTTTEGTTTTTTTEGTTTTTTTTDTPTTTIPHQTTSPDFSNYDG